MEKKIKMVTLMVTTSPSDAICFLTYNGTTYTTKSIRVEEGSTVDYRITRSDYVESIGSWVITEDTVKNVTIEHKKTVVVIRMKNSFDLQNITGTITVGTDTQNVTVGSKWKSWTIEVLLARPTVTYDITHPVAGSRSGSLTPRFYYNTNSRITITLGDTGTYTVATTDFY